jgi:hypothetical protein
VTAEPKGRFVVRLPQSLHVALTAEARVEGTSLNQLVVAKLAMSLRDRCGLPVAPAPTRRVRLVVEVASDLVEEAHDPLAADAVVGPFTRGGVVRDRAGAQWACAPLFASGVWLIGHEPTYPCRSHWLMAPLNRYFDQYEPVYVDVPA